MTERPNVILILTDDQGYGDLSCTGNPVLQTPHLDQLHDQSVRLTDYHVDAMCSPTRAALMTGRYAARTGVGIYSQRHVRQKERDNGFWAIDIEQDGKYEFELRRWPVEIDTPICAALPGRTDVPYVDDLLPGEALAIKTAKLQVGDIVQQKAVSEKDKYITFHLSVKKGSTRVQTYFDDGIDAPPGAYYVYIKRIRLA